MTSSARLLALAAAALALAPGLSRAADLDASVQFARGLEAADRGDFERALAEFEGAYTAEPRYQVLYNIAQALAHLSCPREAAQHLNRYLNDGGEQIPLERQQAVRDALERLAREEGAPAQGACSVPSAEPAAPPVRSVVPALMPASLIAPAPALVTPAPAPTGLPAAPTLDAGVARGTRRAWRWGAAGTGVALAAGAAVLYGWNEQRYRAWIRTDDELAHAPYATPDVLERQSDNDARLRSIHTVDWVTAAMAVAALAASAAATVLFVRSRKGER